MSAASTSGFTASSGSADSQLFDGKPPTPSESRAAALEALSGDEGMLEILAPHFGGSASSQAQSVKTALQQGDAAQVRHWSHTLKGTLLTVGAKSSSALAAKIERAAREGQLDGLGDSVDRLIAETDVLITHLCPAT